MSVNQSLEIPIIILRLLTRDVVMKVSHFPGSLALRDSLDRGMVNHVLLLHLQHISALGFSSSGRGSVNLRHAR